MKPHRHSEVIKAWADGLTVQVQLKDGSWQNDGNPVWSTGFEYRVKPKEVDVESLTSAVYALRDRLDTLFETLVSVAEDTSPQDEVILDKFTNCMYQLSILHDKLGLGNSSKVYNHYKNQADLLSNPPSREDAFD